MAYTVKQVARLSGVSVRALHFYDQVALFKPAYYGANGYRFYEEPQLLTLQQILFYRELGFELRHIKRILGRKDFEIAAALESHRKVLRANLARTRKLIATIDKTIEHLKGKKKMNTAEMFQGFSPEEQDRHERYLIDRFGEEMKKGLAQSKARVRNWSKADWQRSGETFQQICSALVQAMRRRLPADSDQVQGLVRRHYQWIQRFWTPTRESYVGHSQLIVDSELRKPYEAHDPHLPEFAAAAIKIFAEKELA